MERSGSRILQEIGDRVSNEMAELVSSHSEHPGMLLEQLDRVVKLRLAEAFAEGWQEAVYTSQLPFEGDIQ
jgi:hypothetical protein